MADLPSVGQILDKGDPDNPSMVLAQEVFIACSGLLLCFRRNYWRT